MGVLNRGQLVAAGLLEAGNTSLTTLANGWLNDWLDSTALAWPWPVLQRRIAGVALASGTQSLSFGNGAAGVSVRVSRVIDPIWVYDSLYSTKVRARIIPLLGTGAGWDESINDPSTNIGIPQRFKLRADESVAKRWSLIPTPVPDRALLLAIDYICIPAQLAADATVPWYENDRTIRQAIKCAALNHMKKVEELQAEREVLRSYSIEDRVKFGEQPGTNDQLGLDPAVFS